MQPPAYIHLVQTKPFPSFSGSVLKRRPLLPAKGPKRTVCSVRSGEEALTKAEIVECGGLHQKANGELGQLHLPCLQVPPFPEVKEVVEEDLLVCISKRH